MSRFSIKVKYIDCNPNASSTKIETLPSYKFSCTYENKQSWNVHHTLTEVSTIVGILKGMNIRFDYPTANELHSNDTYELERYFNFVLAQMKDDIWNNKQMLEFLDDQPNKSILTQLQIDWMKNEIAILHHKARQSDMKINEIENKTNLLINCLFSRNPGKNKSEDGAEKLTNQIFVSTDGDINSPASPLTAENLQQFTDLFFPTRKLKAERKSQATSRNNSMNKLSFTSAVTSGSAMSNVASFGSSNIFQSFIHLPEIPDEYVASSSDEDEQSSGSAYSLHTENAEEETSKKANYQKKRGNRTNFHRTLPKKKVGGESHNQNPTADFHQQEQAFDSTSPNALQAEDSMLLRTESLIPDEFSSALIPFLSTQDKHSELNSPSVENSPKGRNESMDKEVRKTLSVADQKRFPDLINPNEPTHAINDELIFNADVTAYLQPGVEEVMSILEPHEEQLIYRSSAISTFRRQCRKSLSSNAYEVGLHEILCFLPDDTIKLSVVVSKSRLSDWHKALMEQITNNLVDQQNAATSMSSINFLDEDPEQDVLEEYKPIMNHVVTNVSFASYNLNFKVHCLIDTLDVEIIANCRSDLCLLAFMEELSQMIGKDCLFKRSVLLIRAWWCYETAAYAGSTIRHYLSDLCICVMICAIFNQHHRVIKTPFQALSLFINQYANYDGLTQVITLQGIVPFKSENSNQPLLTITPAKSTDFLIPSSMLERYFQMFNLGQLNDDVEDIPAISYLSSSSSEREENMQNDISPFLGNLGNSNSITLENSPNVISKSAALLNTILKTFDRFSFNVVHPFTLSNMIPDKISSRRVSKLMKVFEMGAINLHRVLTAAQAAVQINKTKGFTNPTSFFATLFPSTLSKFSKNQRPDVMNGTIPITVGRISRSILSTPCFDRILSNIQFFDLVLESLISEHALLTVSNEILADKGPLPVGEVGKVLTELSSNPNLSQKLKEAFGGLKKFLERFPERFVIVNDHPFNPHVLLKKTLTQQQLDMIHRGILPPQLTNKSKKASANSKKKAANARQATSTGGIVSNLSANASSFYGNPVNATTEVTARQNAGLNNTSFNSGHANGEVSISSLISSTTPATFNQFNSGSGFGATVSEQSIFPATSAKTTALQPIGPNVISNNPKYSNASLGSGTSFGSFHANNQAPGGFSSSDYIPEISNGYALQYQPTNPNLQQKPSSNFAATQKSYNGPSHVNPQGRMSASNSFHSPSSTIVGGGRTSPRSSVSPRNSNGNIGPHNKSDSDLMYINNSVGNNNTLTSGSYMGQNNNGGRSNYNAQNSQQQFFYQSASNDTSRNQVHAPNYLVSHSPSNFNLHQTGSMKSNYMYAGNTQNPQFNSAFQSNNQSGTDLKAKFSSGIYSTAQHSANGNHMLSSSLSQQFFNSSNSTNLTNNVGNSNNNGYRSSPNEQYNGDKLVQDIFNNSFLNESLNNNEQQLSPMDLSGKGSNFEQQYGGLFSSSSLHPDAFSRSDLLFHDDENPLG